MRSRDRSSPEQGSSELGAGATIISSRGSDLAKLNPIYELFKFFVTEFAL